MVSATTQIGEHRLTIDDLTHVDPRHPFWISMQVEGFVDGEPTAHHHRTAILSGTIDGIPWSATVQSGRVKLGPRRYGIGWANLISLEVGWLAAAHMAGRRIAEAKATTNASSEQPDIDGIPERAAHAARRAHVQLEQARRYVDGLRLAIDPDVDITALPLDDQVDVVARVYNDAVKAGVKAPRSRVMSVLGIPERTATRRIQRARELGRIKERP